MQKNKLKSFPSDIFNPKRKSKKMKKGGRQSKKRREGRKNKEKEKGEII